MKIVQMLYSDQWPEISGLIRRAPLPAFKVLLVRLQDKDAEWRKTRHDMNEIWGLVQKKNYHKSLDHRSFQFKQADKKALSSLALAQEVRAAMLAAAEAPGTGAGMSFAMPDDALHEDILSVVLLGISPPSEQGSKWKERKDTMIDRVRKFFTMFVHVFFGLREYDPAAIEAHIERFKKAEQDREEARARAALGLDRAVESPLRGDDGEDKEEEARDEGGKEQRAQRVEEREEGGGRAEGEESGGEGGADGAVAVVKAEPEEEERGEVEDSGAAGEAGLIGRLETKVEDKVRTGGVRDAACPISTG